MRRFLIGCLTALAALAAKADGPFAAFVKAGSDERAAVRLEARTNATVAAWGVTGTVPMISPDGTRTADWDTTKSANGWTEISSGAAKASQLVLNAPDFAVEGGRLMASANWTADAVHLVLVRRPPRWQVAPGRSDRAWRFPRFACAKRAGHHPSLAGRGFQPRRILPPIPRGARIPAAPHFAAMHHHGTHGNPLRGTRKRLGNGASSTQPPAFPQKF